MPALKAKRLSAPAVPRRPRRTRSKYDRLLAAIDKHSYLSPSPAMKAAVAALGRSAPMALRRVLTTPTYLGRDSAHRCAPRNAAMLLAHVQGKRCAGLLLDVLIALPDDDFFAGMEIVRQLRAMGPSILDMAWEAYEKARPNDRARRSALAVLAGLGVRDDRIKTALAAEDMGVIYDLVGMYGDLSLLPALKEAYMRERDNVPSPDPIGDDHLDYCNLLSWMEESIRSVEGANGLATCDLPGPRWW